MADVKVGKVIHLYQSSSILEVVRLLPQEGNSFPDYKPGQYIALMRDDCIIRKKVRKEDGTTDYATALDGKGSPMRGPVTHSYSIASAPHETREHEYLEFYIVLEILQGGSSGRLTESLFRVGISEDNKIHYHDRIAGNFTLDRANGFQNVVMVGTGTGVAPFISMVKHLHFEALNGRGNNVRYTLIHANRTFQELDYYCLLKSIEGYNKFDFVYMPSVSRPTEEDLCNQFLGKGRANNLLRCILDMETKEEEDLNLAAIKDEDSPKAMAAAERVIQPILPQHINTKKLEERIINNTVVMTCGNKHLMADIQSIAENNGLRFEKEDW